MARRWTFASIAPTPSSCSPFLVRGCVARALRRSLMNRGKSIQAAGCPERLDREFLRWIWRYPTDSKPRLDAALRAHAQHARGDHLPVAAHVVRAFDSTTWTTERHLRRGRLAVGPSASRSVFRPTRNYRSRTNENPAGHPSLRNVNTVTCCVPPRMATLASSRQLEAQRLAEPFGRGIRGVVEFRDALPGHSFVRYQIDDLHAQERSEAMVELDHVPDSVLRRRPPGPTSRPNHPSW